MKANIEFCPKSGEMNKRTVISLIAEDSKDTEVLNNLRNSLDVQGTVSLIGSFYYGSLKQISILLPQTQRQKR